MAQVITFSERFNGGAVLNADNPGGLGTITVGSITPHLADTTGGALFAGVMPDADFKSYVSQSISGGASEVAIAIVRLKDFGPNVNLNNVLEISSGVNVAINVGFNSAGAIVCYDPGAGVAATTGTATYNDWIMLALAVRKNVDNSTEYIVKMGVNGGALTTIKTRAAYFDGFTSLDRIGFVDYSGDGTSNWRGHVAYFGVGTITNFAGDVAYPAGPLPTKAQNIWKMIATGNAANAGTASLPWNLSKTKFVSEAMDGIFEGDEIVIDGSAGFWDIGANVVDIHAARGFTMTFIGEPRPWKDRTGASSGGSQVWTAHDANVWKFSDTDLTNAILYVNDAPMPTHPVGPNLAAVIAALDATVGAFWTDGATMYANFGYNPNTTAGKTIVTSRDRTYNYDLAPGTHGAPVFHYTNCGGDFVINNLTCRYTGYISPTDNNNPFEGDCIRVGVGCTNFTLTLNAPNFDHFGKHALTYAADNATRVRVNASGLTFGKGPPYVNAGGWTSVALSIGAGGNGDAQGSFSNGIGTDTTGYPFLIIHGQVDAFSSVTLTNIIAAKQPVINQGTSSAVPINDCTLGGLNQSLPKTMTMNRGTLNGGISGTGITCFDVKIVPTENLSAANTNVQISGTINLYNCTIDVSGCTVGDANAALFYRTAAMAFKCIGATWIDGGKDIAQIANAAAGEVTSDYNYVSKPAANRWLENYNAADATGTQAIALGIDTHSVFGATGFSGQKLSSSSAGRNLVSIAAYPILAGTLDNTGRVRASSGFTDAGAFLFVSKKDDGFHARNRRRIFARRRSARR